MKNKYIHLAGDHDISTSYHLLMTSNTKIIVNLKLTYTITEFFLYVFPIAHFRKMNYLITHINITVVNKHQKHKHHYEVFTAFTADSTTPIFFDSAICDNVSTYLAEHRPDVRSSITKQIEIEHSSSHRIINYTQWRRSRYFIGHVIH